MKKSLILATLFLSTNIALAEEGMGDPFLQAWDQNSDGIATVEEVR